MPELTKQHEKSSESVVSDNKRLTSSGRWSKTLLNFWLDSLLAITFLLLVWVSAVLRFLFPTGTSSTDLFLWGLDVHDWRDVQFVVLCVFSLGILLHLMLHWTWICGVVMKHFVGRPPARDDGTQTLIGVGLILVILHALAAGLLLAWYCLEQNTASVVG